MSCSEAWLNDQGCKDGREQATAATHSEYHLQMCNRQHVNTYWRHTMHVTIDHVVWRSLNIPST